VVDVWSMNFEFDITVDVLVIGAGGCGLVAAIAAAAEGASVAVLEKNRRMMGNTVLSSGSIPGAGSRMQRAAGIDDSSNRFTRDLFAVSGSHDADHITRRLAGISAELVEWLVDEANVTLTLVETYHHVGHSVPRLHAPPSRRGTDLIADLEAEIERRDIPIAFGQPAVSLLTDAGRVVGVETRDETGQASSIGAGAVILATNGFGGSKTLLQQHCPNAATATYAGATGSTGEALAWGIELGAGIGNLAAYQGHAGLAERSGNLVTWTVIERGGLIVDAHGRRFGDETIGYSAFAAKELAAQGPLHMIYDARIEADVAAGQPEFAEIAKMGDASGADDAQTLAKRIGVDGHALAATLEDARRSAGDDVGGDAFDRSTWGLGPLTPPYRATRITPALFHTQGGLMIDDDGQVLRGDGQPVSGLYAGGGAAVGISGRDGGNGYVSGNGLLSALGLGYLAGKAAARARHTPENNHQQRPQKGDGI
jgi:fumarate reductase flavoprotein subunit